MRIGVTPTLSRAAGGIYQYSLSLLDALEACANHDEVVLFASEADADIDRYRSKWEVRPAHPLRRVGGASNAVDRLRQTYLRQVWLWVKPLLRGDVGSSPGAEDWILKQRVDLMMYPAPTALAYEDAVPYLMAIHDLQHRLHPEFPEVSAGGEYEIREKLFRAAAEKALFLLTDSEIGREDVLSAYGEFGATADRVKILPFCPPLYLDLDPIAAAERDARLNEYGLPERFLFYPAALWPHKNHKTIVRALGLLRSSGLEVPLVLCGSSEGWLRQKTLAEVRRLARDLQIDQQIRYLSYVPEGDMRLLYERAAALVMPTFFGPTNIPIYEAWMLKCPVVTSDIRGIREQVGDAGLLVDPDSPDALADALAKVWGDPALAASLIAKATERMQRFGPDQFRQRFGQILQEARERVST